MNKQGAINFLFAIATEIKRSFETPIILVTMKDYAEGIFRSLLDMRSALQQAASPCRVLDIISGFHLQWLQAVYDIEAFKKRIRDTPREHISKAIDFTVECVNRRMKQFRKYIDQMVTTMTADENTIMQDTVDIMSEMHDSFISSLRDKQKTFFTMVDTIEYYYKVLDETEELLIWLDTLNDNLAMQFSKVTGLKFPELAYNLTKTLQQIVEEVSESTNPEADMIANEIESRGRTLSFAIRLGSTHDDLGIKLILEKIKSLEDRLDRLKTENSSAVMAIQHKTLYLEERLMSLDNLRSSLFALKNKNKEGQERTCFHIFDHLLPPQDRCRLIDDLIKLWTDALNSDQECKSIISILSVADIKEIFSDEIGKFTVDKYGRKLYKGGDGYIYKLNEMSELVPLKDDEEYVYFYDECGRYYFNEKKERIYKAYDTASEYCINRDGLMLKFKEYREGREYWYDHLGRYNLNEKGKQIYCDEDGKIYENDGLGNLVRVRNNIDYEYVVCPPEPVVTEESNYLQKTVGAALKKCIATVLLRQPADPVNFLAKCLEDYQNSIQAREARLADEVALMAEREQRMRDAYQASTAPCSPYSGEAEVCYADPNFSDYHTIVSED